MSRRDRCQVGEDIALAIVELPLWLDVASRVPSWDQGFSIMQTPWPSLSPCDSLSHAEWKLLLHLAVPYT